MSIIEKSSIDEKSYYAKKPFTTPMILLYNDTLLSLQHKDSVNGMLRMQKAGVQKVYKGLPILK